MTSRLGHTNSTDAEQLLQRVEQGDRRAAEQLLQAQRDYLRRMLEARMEPALRQRVDPSDIIQETLMEANRRLDDYLRRRPTTFRLWIRRKALEQLVNARRHHRARKRSIEREGPLTAASSLAIARAFCAERASAALERQERAAGTSRRPATLGGRPGDSRAAECRAAEQRRGLAAAGDRAQDRQQAVRTRRAEAGGDFATNEGLAILTHWWVAQIAPQTWACQRHLAEVGLCCLGRVHEMPPVDPLRAKGPLDETFGDGSNQLGRYPMTPQTRNGEWVEQVLGEVVGEFFERVNRGERPDIEEYALLYPEIADKLRQGLSALLLLGQTTSTHGSSRGSGNGHEAPLTGVLGDFRVLHEIGRGGMGVVYEAEQISLGRRVALKILPFASLLDPRQLTRFQNEARATATLNHPHIVPVYTSGVDRGVHYLAMRLIDGESLARYGVRVNAERGTGNAEVKDGGSAEPNQQPAINQQCPTSTLRDVAIRTHASGDQQQSFRRVAQWGVEAAEGLEHAHGLGIIHRDIKPANLLVDQDGKLWITDFGLARMPTDAGLTMTGDMLGTLRYMSPEQAMARHSIVDHRSDIYSLGATLYELLTGEPVVQGKDREAILKSLAESEATPPRKLAPAIPVDLETIVLKAIARHAMERYSSAGELAMDLQRALRNEPIKARRQSVAQRTFNWFRRRPQLAGAIGVFAVLIVLVSVTATSLVARANGQLSVAVGKAEAEAKRANTNWLNSIRLLNDIGDALEDDTHVVEERFNLIHNVMAKHYKVFQDVDPEDPELIYETLRPTSRQAWQPEVTAERRREIAREYVSKSLMLYEQFPHSEKYRRTAMWSLWLQAGILRAGCEGQSALLKFLDHSVDDAGAPRRKDLVVELRRIYSVAAEREAESPTAFEWTFLLVLVYRPIGLAPWRCSG